MGRKYYWVYVLYSMKDQKQYIGFTTNLKRRFGEHNAGKTKSTAPRRPFRLLFAEVYISEADAMRRERYFKTDPGKKTLKLMLKESRKELDSAQT
jgi:putative endonuclease